MITKFHEVLSKSDTQDRDNYKNIILTTLEIPELMDIQLRRLQKTHMKFFE